jgi:hypothetical protein
MILDFRWIDVVVWSNFRILSLGTCTFLFTGGWGDLDV